MRMECINVIRGSCGRYDSVENITRADEGQRQVSYEYDCLGRLVSETVENASGTYVTKYTYDRNSNRVSVDVNGDVTEYVYNEINQLVKAGSTEFTYDSEGNLVSKSSGGVLVSTYTYDSFGRLTGVTGYAGGSSVDATYSYDDEGNRISSSVNGDKTNYVLDLSSGYSQVLRSECDREIVNYTRGIDLISRTQGEETLYYLYDACGSVRLLVDEEGDISDTYIFDAFGNLTESTYETNNSYGFQGRRDGCDRPLLPQSPATWTRRSEGLFPRIRMRERSRAQ